MLFFLMKLFVTADSMSDVLPSLRVTHCLKMMQVYTSTRLHSSRMRTVRVLTVSLSMLCSGGVPGPGGVYLVWGSVPGPRGLYLVWGVYLVLGVYLV